MSNPRNPDDTLPQTPNPTNAKKDELSVRRQKREQLRVRAEKARFYAEQDFGLCAREFVLCGLPYKRTKELLYERQNGYYRLQVTAHPKYGMPFGQDRLLPIWLATAFYAAGCPADNTLYLRFAKDILRTFRGEDAKFGGEDLRRLQERIQRVFGATFFVRELIDGGWHELNYRLISRVHLWFTNQFRANQYWGEANEIELSPEFANDLRRAAVPVDLHSVRALKEQPAVLDLYIWEAWRSYRYAAQWGVEGLHHNRGRIPALKIPVFGPNGLLAQLGTHTQSEKKQRQLLRHWHQEVKRVWEKCPNTLSEDGNYLMVLPAQAVFFPTKRTFLGLLDGPPKWKDPLPEDYTGALLDLSVPTDPTPPKSDPDKPQTPEEL